MNALIIIALRMIEKFILNILCGLTGTCSAHKCCQSEVTMGDTEARLLKARAGSSG